MTASTDVPPDVQDELARLRQQVAQLEQEHVARKLSSERDAESSNRYDLLFDFVPVAIWEEDVSKLMTALERLRCLGVSDIRQYLLHHPEFLREAAEMITVTNVNHEAVRLYGARNKHDLLNSEIRVLMPESKEAFREELLAISERKDRFRTEAVIKTFDGRTVDVLVEMRIPHDDGSFRNLLLIIVDISDRVRTHRDLKESEERLQTIFQAAQDCIYLKDAGLRFTHVNRAMERLLDRPAGSIRGKRADDLFGTAAGAHIRDVDLRVLSGECVEEEHTRPVNGVPITFHDIRVPLRDAAGTIVGLCGISRNITDLKKARRAHAPISLEYPSAAMGTLLAEARRAAQTDAIVLVLGESGSGKDHFSRWIHDHSRRSNGPFFSVNCAAIPGELAESELFGHEAGAFTGARARRRGLLELAEGGTLLLNEIGELTLPLQSKLLSFLDTRSFVRVGGEKSISVNARIIAATHRDLELEVSRERFLNPLWYRLNVLSINVPPLRERREDMPVLVKELLPRLCEDMNVDTEPRVSHETMIRLQAYHWPGNVRELRNVLERALMISDGPELTVAFPNAIAQSNDWSFTVSPAQGKNLDHIIDLVTCSLCTEVLRICKGNRIEASRQLGISRTALYRLMKRFGLLRESETSQNRNARS